jgi:hypothetical protein
MGKRLSAREERVMTDKDTFKFEIETLTGDGIGLEYEEASLFKR